MTVKGGNRRYCTLGGTAWTGTPRYLYEWASTPKPNTHGIFWFLPFWICRIYSWWQRLAIETKPSPRGTWQGCFKQRFGVLRNGNHVMAVSSRLWRAGTSKWTTIDPRGQHQCYQLDYQVIPSQVFSIQTCCSFRHTKDVVDSLQVTKLYSPTPPSWATQFNCGLAFFWRGRTFEAWIREICSKPNCVWLSSQQCCFSQSPFFFFPPRSRWFQNLTPTQRSNLIFLSGNANTQIFFNAKTEARNETYDRVWRRWSYFCKDSLGGENPLLDEIPREESDLFLWSFLEMHQESDFNVTGHVTRKFKVPMVRGTIAEAACSLVKTMWDSNRRRPFDIPKSSNKSGFSASVQDLIKAMMSTSPSTKSQKAITPAFL